MTRLGWTHLCVRIETLDQLRALARERGQSVSGLISDLASLKTVLRPQIPVNDPSVDQDNRASTTEGSCSEVVEGSGPDRIRTDDLRRVRPTFLPSHGFLAS